MPLQVTFVAHQDLSRMPAYRGCAIVSMTEAETRIYRHLSPAVRNRPGFDAWWRSLQQELRATPARSISVDTDDIGRSAAEIAAQRRLPATPDLVQFLANVPLDARESRLACEVIVGDAQVERFNIRQGG